MPSTPRDFPPDETGPRDACGVFGVLAPGEEVAKLTYFGLYALQHRGQESAGIAVSNAEQILVYKNMGLVSQVFDEVALASLQGELAVGHCRYSTTGASTWENAQPTFRSTGPHAAVALAHNGNLTNTLELSRSLGAGARGARTTSDTDLITALLAAAMAQPDNREPGTREPGTREPGTREPDARQPEDHRSAPSLEQAALEVLPRLRGAYCLVFMDETTLYAARDPQGIHPLVLGRLERGWVVASETSALDIVGATFLREIEPGELVVIDANGPRSHRFAAAEPKGCLFEFVYLARPDTRITGTSVHASRVEVGRRLARQAPVEADLVMPVPESATPAAIGYAEQSGIPYGHGLVKNSYVGRTFIQPSQTIRQLGVRLKYNPLREVIEGRRLVVVDDSIVRGTTQRALVRMLREAGAVEVHVRVSSPPVRWPCFYGIDFASSDELIANDLTIDGIRDSIGADSLGYISLDQLVAATDLPVDQLCRACFDGVYPVEIPEAARAHGKRQLELEEAGR